MFLKNTYHKNTNSEYFFEKKIKNKFLFIVKALKKNKAMLIGNISKEIKDFNKTILKFKKVYYDLEYDSLDYYFLSFSDNLNKQNEMYYNYLMDFNKKNKNFKYNKY